MSGITVISGRLPIIFSASPLSVQSDAVPLVPWRR
jgi:hypothetical protein